MAREKVIPVLDQEAQKAWEARDFGPIPLKFLRSIVRRRYENGDVDGTPVNKNQVAIGVDLAMLESIAKENKERSRYGGRTLNELRELVFPD